MREKNLLMHEIFMIMVSEVYKNDDGSIRFNHDYHFGYNNDDSVCR